MSASVWASTALVGSSRTRTSGPPEAPPRARPAGAVLPTRLRPSRAARSRGPRTRPSTMSPAAAASMPLRLSGVALRLRTPETRARPPPDRVSPQASCGSRSTTSTCRRTTSIGNSSTRTPAIATHLSRRRVRVAAESRGQRARLVGIRRHHRRQLARLDDADRCCCPRAAPGVASSLAESAGWVLPDRGPIRRAPR